MSHKIDTSTTAGKIKVMQACDDGYTLQYKHILSDVLHDFNNKNPFWNWVECDYFIKPQTAEEAAKESWRNNYLFSSAKHSFLKAFELGAKWREENPRREDNE